MPTLKRSLPLAQCNTVHRLPMASCRLTAKIVVRVVAVHSVVSDPIATPCSVAHQTPLSMGFFRQEYCSQLPFPFPGDLPDLGIKSESPALAG